MSWRDIMYRVLPPIGGVPPHVTSPYGARSSRPLGSTNPHGGVDFNYEGGRYAPLNQSHPAIRSPVDGVVTNAGEGTVGRIAIRDADGFSHEILHTHARHVSVGDPVSAGQLIGTMGNTGTHDQHIHYQLKDPAGSTISPSEFWDRQGPADPSPLPPAYLGEYQQYLEDGGAGSYVGSGNAQGTAFRPGPVTPDADPSPSPVAAEISRHLGKRVAGQSKSTVFDKGTVAVPFTPNQPPPSSRPNALDSRFGNWTSLPTTLPSALPSPAGDADFSTRFGNWTSSPAGTAPADTPADGPRGIVTGKPMRAVPLPPSIWGLPDGSGVSDDDWFSRWFRPGGRSSD